MGWILTGQAMHNNTKELLPFVPDLRKDRFHVWITKWHWIPVTFLGVLIFAIGGWSCLLWGLFLRTRSEEHTSELQSRLHLVCRLLLEKKKTRRQVRSVVGT